MTQSELADKAGLPRYLVAQIESGKSKLPVPENRRKLAAALGLSHLDLLIAAGEIEPDEIRAAGAVAVPVVDPERQTLIDRILAIRLDGDRYEALEDILDGFVRRDRKAREAVDHPAGELHESGLR